MEGIYSEYIATSIKGNNTLFDQAIIEPPTIDGHPINQSLFPKTRYYGSKLRLIEWISACTNDLNFHTALDAFGGTATVSLMLKFFQKNVTYNDVLASNQYIAKALLQQERKYNPLEINSFFKSVTPTNGFISKTFKDHYYYDEENYWLDGATQALHRLRSEQKKADNFYCLYQACLQKRPFNLFHRKNLYIRQNCTRDTKFGNWRTWEKTFQEHIETAAKELVKAKSIHQGSATILSPSDASEIKPGYDLIYIDPPYLKQNNSGNGLTYLDRYHFLEGMALYKDWPEWIDKKKKNYPFQPIKSVSEWNKKATFKDRLFDLISRHNKSIVLLSYSTDGFPSVDELMTHFKANFANVIILQKNLSHALRKTENKEILIIGV